jgi:methyl-accepting chemotaxis protein
MTSFYDLRAAVKLALCFGLMAAMLITVGAVGISAAAGSDASVTTAYDRDIEGVDLANRVETERVKMARSYLQGMVSGTATGRDKAVREVEDGQRTVADLLPKLKASVVEDTDVERCDAAGRDLGTYASLASEAVRASATDEHRARELMARASPMGRHISELLEQVLAGKHRVAEQTRIEAHARYVRSRTVVLGVTFAALAFAFACSVVLGRAFADPLNRSLAVLDRVAEGDLSASLDVTSKDEVGRMAAALNRSLASVRTTMVGVRSIAREVTAVAAELAASSETISQNTQEQAASLEETAASLEEISATVRQNADNAEQAVALADGARDAAERGGKVVKAAVDAMTDITRSSGRIADIITTIDEIAFQTNLLALNAAVEAARAGDHGRGFGVVAAEVRTLAQRTGAAARQVRSLIGDSAGNVETGTAEVNRSGETLQEIVRSVNRVTAMVRDIAGASREQNTGVNQVNSAVARIDEVTQGNARRTGDVSTTAASLSEKAVALEALLAAFKLGEDGGCAVQVPRQAPRQTPTPVAATRARVQRPATRARVAPLRRHA